MALPTKDSAPGKLGTALGSDRVRAAAETDSVGGAAPRWVATVDGTEQVSAAMRVAAEHQLRVVATGSGSKLDWGAPPREVDLLMDLSAASGIVEHAAGDLVVHAKAGTSLRGVQEQVAGSGQQLSIEHPLPTATLGGVIATSAAGPCRHLHGTVRDLLIGITVVRPDGVVTRSGGKVVKNVAGYDLGKLYSGSFGSLGVITEAIFRLHPLAAERRWLSVDADEPAMLDAVLRSVKRTQAMPTAVELDRTIDGRTMVCVQIEGRADVTHQRALTLSEVIGRETGGNVDVHNEAPAWWSHYPHGTGDDIGLRLTVRPASIPGAVSRAAEAAQRCGVKLSLRGAAGIGVLDGGIPAGTDPGAVADLVATLRTLTSAPGEHTVIVRAPRAVTATVDPWGPVPSGVLTLLKNTKTQFDPEHRLAPGRFVGGI